MRTRACTFAALFVFAVRSALAIAAAATPARIDEQELKHWKTEAQAVTIVRDDLGIAHIHGVTDADAVFGLIYAQAEDDFSRVESNYIHSLGRLAEAEGEAAVFSDLRIRLFIDPQDLKARYASSPSWLKLLMSAWADGLNYFLAMHPQIKPRVIKHFEPWMTLSFSEGSIGGDIERISTNALEAFYGKPQPPKTAANADWASTLREPSGSNGIAIAPANTVDHHALLLINPHTSLYFRSEVKVASDQGLNAYGAVTWGQIFVYQGFNEHCGWMHTSSGANAMNEYKETIIRHAMGLRYRYGAEERPVVVSTIRIPYRKFGGATGERSFKVYRTHHGPIVRQADGKWISVALMFRPVETLSQSFLRTKAHDYASFMEVAQLKANSSNNTVFADADGNIAYLNPQFVPRRDDHFDYSKPVDGSDPATDWKGVHELNESPHLLNPSNGWIANTNNWPYAAAGEQSPKQRDYPRYMDTAGENPRGIHAYLVLRNRKDFTLQSLITAAFDPYLPAFARLIPELIGSYDQTPDSDPSKAPLKEQIALLRAWDYRWGLDSAATSLAIFWAEELSHDVQTLASDAGMKVQDYIVARTGREQRLKSLAAASQRLMEDFGSWRTPWGEVNRFQRLNDDLEQAFDDAKASIAVPFTSGEWGSLAAFGARRYNGTRRFYGTSGNSFVAAVEFGPTVRARAVIAGGHSGDPASPHFDDEADRYANGNLREVYFYDSQLQGHIERTYHPGE
jgi:acyl-homoserine-lactone acylase